MNRPSPAAATLHAGVTLVQMVFIVALIALLTALAFPLFHSAVEQTHTAKCLHNLRLLGTAIQQYATEHNDLLPRGDVPQPNGAYTFWPAPLAPYLGYEYPQVVATQATMRRSPLACPAEREHSGFHYAQNRELNERLYGANAFIRQRQVSTPSRYVLLSDAFHDRTIFTDLRSKMVGMTRMTRRHNGKPNFLYADSHAAPFGEPIYGISDTEGKSPFYQSLWRARYP